ncbi:MAG: rRNA pseudouridine synthase [Coriobacteriia bacterium]|nr:rRNA pseudouridine synthase [Coriobacteriia bacterium]
MTSLPTGNDTGPAKNGASGTSEESPRTRSADEDAPERLQKFLSRAGVSSRRGAEDLIVAGRVSVNGTVVSALGTKVIAGRDEVRVDGRPVALPSTLWYVMLNKPAGVVTTLDDPQGRLTVARFVPADAPRLFPVGRLDAATTGLLLLTNDGQLAHALMHPRHHVPKMYHATVDGVPDGEDLRRLRVGIDLDDGMTAPAEARLLERSSDGTAVVELVLREGRKRQVRRMLSAISHPVRKLARVAYGPLPLGGLAVGSVRRLTDDEVRLLHDAAFGGTA